MIEPKILIDTNILIGLEDFQEVAEKFATLHQKCQKSGVRLYVHEASRRDIARDKDAHRRQIMLSKIEKFLPLDGLYEPSVPDLEANYGSIGKPNDHIDCLLLFALDKINAVDFLITQDRNLHKRAARAGISDRVFRVEDAIVWLRDTFDSIKVSLPFIEERQCHQIDRRDDIFVSLTEDYPAFEDWFAKSCVRQHRDCWTINFSGEIAGIAIRKDEKYDDVMRDIPSSKELFLSQPKKILKICTFKIKEKYRGEKLGEQLIKQVLWWANKNKYELVYLTVYPKHKYLIDMLQFYGFVMLGRTKGELYLGKLFAQGFIPSDASDAIPLSYHKKYYPNFLSGEDVGKYLIPIKGAYYETLFPENVSKRQLGLFDAQTSVDFSKIPGNTIRKVYVCRAQINNINDGDILLFFHLKDDESDHSQALITVGITDGFVVTNLSEELLKITAKRSVFTPRQLTEFTAGDKKDVKVINFLLAGHISPAIFYDRMKELGIKGPYQSIRKLTQQQFELLEEELILDVKTS